MSCWLRLYLVLLLLAVLGWLGLRGPDIARIVSSHQGPGLLALTLLYLSSHVFRMLRLGLLTLDERDKLFKLSAAHALTAFPSSFLPFKLGEVFRLAAFFHVYQRRRKAFAIWLAERFGDVLVIVAFILGLYLFNVAVPPAMRAVFVLFVVVSIVGLLSLFAIAKVFIYLNRHLVLTSHTSRGLVLLRASRALRGLELDIGNSLDGRLAGFLLLSVLIWGIEILALTLFVNRISLEGGDVAELLASGLLASLPGGVDVFGFYRLLALVALTLFAQIVVWLRAGIWRL